MTIWHLPAAGVQRESSTEEQHGYTTSQHGTTGSSSTASSSSQRQQSGGGRQQQQPVQQQLDVTDEIALENEHSAQTLEIDHDRQQKQHGQQQIVLEALD